MRKPRVLLIGLTIAIMLGYLYMKFSGQLVAPTVQVVVQTTANTSGGSNAILFAIVLFSWVTAFMAMPVWLAIFLDMAIGWVGLAIFVVSGVLVWLAQPNNTLQDPTYVAFLCSIAMVTSRLIRILRSISRRNDD
jgi:hypothetical protein